MEYVDKMLKTSRQMLFAPTPRQNRGHGLFEPGVTGSGREMA
jgi:hypothetical protein